MSTTPPPGPGGPSGEAPEAPASAVGGGTHSPSDAMTRYDKERDIYHCSYGAPSPALTVLDPQREVVVRVDRHNFAVVGFSIPNFTAWHEAHADEDGNFDLELPAVWPMHQTDVSGSTAPW